MLISLSKRFIFVANLKTASTAIEQALSPYSEISLNRAEWGKHSSLANIQAQFAWIFDIVKFEDFVIFGVIRIQWSLS